jgi:hypothetical protein
MKFFIPDIESGKEAERIYDATKSFLKITFGWEATDRRIYAIRYYHDGKYRDETVGKINKRTGEPVIAILESNAYCICTPSHGVVTGRPLFVGQEEVVFITDFDKS